MEPDINESDSEERTKPRLLKRRRTEEQEPLTKKLPPGPATYDDTFLWAEWMVTSLLRMHSGSGVDMKGVLQRTLGDKKIVLSTAYSGMGCPEQSLRFVQDALKKKVDVDLKIEFHSAMDSSPLCRRVLSNMKPGPQHIFGDIFDLIPSKLHMELVKLQTKHRTKFARALEKAPSQRKDLLHKHGYDFLTEACERMRGHKFDLKTKAHCWIHDDMCVVAPSKYAASDNTVFIEVGGHTCTPWSTLGKNFRYLDEQALPAIIWLFWVRAKKPHIVVNECVPQFEGRLIKEALGMDYHVSVFNFSPVDLGLPMNRARRYTVAYLKRLPAGPIALTPELFKELAFRSCDLHGGIFFNAPQEMITAYLDRLARTRGLTPRADRDERPYKYYAVVCAGFRQRAQVYITKAMETGLLKDVGTKDIIVNLMQSPEYDTTLLHTIPTLMRKSQLFSLALRRGMLPLEQMSAQGVPVFVRDRPGLQRLASFSMDFWTSLSDAEVRHLAGNGMALSAVGSILMVTLCSLPAKLRA